MTVAVLVAASAGVAVGALAGLAAGRSRMRRGMLGAGEQLDAAHDRLRAREAEGLEDRRVRDQILSSMEDGVLLFDAGGRTRFANKALERHLGEVPHELAELLPVEIRKVCERASYIGHIESVEVETGMPSRWLRGTAIAAGDDGAVLLVVRDVTEARRLDAIRRDFVANASHELKTPAASIQATAETLRTATDDPQAVARFAAGLEKEALRLSRIVADLLDLSRLESGSDRDGWVRLDTIAREETQRFEEAALGADLSLTARVEEVPALRGSGRDLSLLMRNLIDNAIRYTKPEGSVEVRVSGGSDEVELTVADTGVGIPSRELPRVFERFYRVDRARSRDTGGTGLGLAIVKHVAENHGGTVEVDSELGRGTTVRVRLPVTTEEPFE